MKAVIYARYSSDNQREESIEGQLRENMAFAEYYSVELAEMIKRGMTENALKLRSNGVRAPIGYYIDDEKHFQIDENIETDIIQYQIRNTPNTHEKIF